MSPRGRHPREGGGRSPVPPQRREVSGRDQLISDSQEAASRPGGARGGHLKGGQERERERDLIGGYTEEESYSGTKRGVSSGKKLTTGGRDQSGASLVNGSGDSSILDRSKRESSKNRSVSGDRTAEVVRSNGTETKNTVKPGETGTSAVGSSHSRDYAGSEGASKGGVKGTGGTGGTGEGRKHKGRRRRKGEGDGSDSGSSCEESADGSEEAAGEGKKRRRGRRGRGRGTGGREGTGSETEDSSSGGGEGRGDKGHRSGIVSGVRDRTEGDRTEGDRTDTLGRGLGEAIGDEIGAQRERKDTQGGAVSGSTGNERMSAATGREGIGIQLVSGGEWDGKRGPNRNSNKWESKRGGTDAPGSALEQRSADRTEQRLQLESSSQILNSLLTAKRPGTAFPAVSSSYNFALTPPYTFSYYKS